MVHQELLALEKIRTVLVGQSLRLDAPESFWIQVIVPAGGHAVRNCSETVRRVTEQFSRACEFSKSWWVRTLDRAVHGQDWAPTTLDEYPLILLLLAVESKAKACVLVPDAKHVFRSRVLLVLVVWQDLLNLGNSHSVANLVFRLECACHFLTERWGRECEFEVNLTTILRHLRN